MNTLPRIEISAVNSACVTVGNATVWFSYKTPIAFQVGSNERVVRKNDWGPTTGQHLNAIDGGNRKGRVKATDFQRLWDAQTGEAN